MAGSVRWLLLLSAFWSLAHAEENGFAECLRKDSISCVQIHIYRKLRALFSQDTINIFGGFQLVKENSESRSIEDNTVEDKMFGDGSVSDRQAILEDFAYNRIANFFNERRLRWGLSSAIDQVASTARMAVVNLPTDLKEKLSNYVVEGRGKKKVLKSLIPILILAKLKFVSLMKLAYVIIALIAKKALVASTIALAITLFISIKKILAKHQAPVYYEVHSEPVHGLSQPDRSGWAPSWSTWDSYDVRGTSGSHHLAYGPQKSTHR